MNFYLCQILTMADCILNQVIADLFKEGIAQNRYS